MMTDNDESSAMSSAILVVLDATKVVISASGRTADTVVLGLRKID